MKKKNSILYRAPFVVPISQPVIEDGALLVQNGRILAVDKYSQLKSDSRVGKIIEFDKRVVLPALINCHSHLELSWMADLGQDSSTFAKGDITAWISGLLAKRDNCQVSSEERRAAAEKALLQLKEEGHALVADIGNQPESIKIGDKLGIDVMFFHESMGLSEKASDFALENINKFASMNCTAHGPYSCHPHLISSLKKRANKTGQLFPIHLAESADEIEFLRGGSGPFSVFLEERLQAIGEFSGQGLLDIFTPPACGAVDYLSKLQVLDDKTLCVHGVHVTASEVEKLAKLKSKVCLCPGSNKFLGVGTAPLNLYLKNGIVPGLGTDSLASNPRLSIWREMKILFEDHPDVDPEIIVKMATLSGAEALNVQDDLGSFEPGKLARFLSIDFDDLLKNDLYSFIVSTDGHSLTCHGDKND